MGSSYTRVSSVCAADRHCAQGRPRRQAFQGGQHCRRCVAQLYALGTRRGSAGQGSSQAVRWQVTTCNCMDTARRSSTGWACRASGVSRAVRGMAPSCCQRMNMFMHHGRTTVESQHTEQSLAALSFAIVSLPSLDDDEEPGWQFFEDGPPRNTCTRALSVCSATTAAATPC